MADGGGNGFGVEALVIGELSGAMNAAENDAIAESEGLRKSILENAATHGVGARLENGPETAVGPAEAGRFDGGANGGGMMGKIVDDENVVDLSFHIHSTFDALKGCESGSERVVANAASLRDDESGEGIENIVAAGGGKRKFAVEIALEVNAKMHLVVDDGDIAGDPIVFGLETVSDDGAEGFLGDLARGFAGGSVAPDDDAAAARNEIDEALEGELIDVEVGVDVGMVELDGGDDEVIGLVVEEFCGFVPIGGIVFVAFENEFGTAGEAVALAEIFGDTADEEIRMLSRHVEDPGEHGGGGGFSVRAADDDGMLAGEKFFFEDFGQRAMRELAVEHLFDFHIAARNGIADDDKIRRGSEILGVERGSVLDAERFEKRGGGRIHAGVRARDFVAAFAKHASEGRHGGAADTNHVNVFHFGWMSFPFHCTTAGSRISNRPSPEEMRRAWTPSGRVSIGRLVWPTAAPKTMGTPRGQRMRSQTS